MTQRVAARNDRIHAALLVLLAVLIGLYWLAYFMTDVTLPEFTHDPAQATLTAVYLGYQDAFPAADGFVALTALIAARQLHRGRATALLMGLVSAGGLAFLALMDILFDLEHGFYAPPMLTSDPGMMLEAAINVGCVGFAFYSARRFWSRREFLLGTGG